jgi:hypothetical protein
MSTDLATDSKGCAHALFARKEGSTYAKKCDGDWSAQSIEPPPGGKFIMRPDIAIGPAGQPGLLLTTATPNGSAANLARPASGRWKLDIIADSLNARLLADARGQFRAVYTEADALVYASLQNGAWNKQTIESEFYGNSDFDAAIAGSGQVVVAEAAGRERAVLYRQTDSGWSREVLPTGSKGCDNVSVVIDGHDRVHVFFEERSTFVWLRERESEPTTSR